MSNKRRTEADEDISKLRRKAKVPKFDQKTATREIKEHFSKRLTGSEVVLTTRTPKGQVLDWVKASSQVKGGRIASPPPITELPSFKNGKMDPQLAGFELFSKRAKLGPEGTVPILHKDVTKLPKGRSLDNILSKSGRPVKLLRMSDEVEIAMPATSGHVYAYSSESRTCYGGEGSLSLFDPYVAHADEFSLLQIALTRGSGSGLQTIEAGVQEYRDLYGDWVPHLFVFYTTNGYTSSGDNKGGYNRDVDGWVQYSSRIYPGARFTVYSERGGAQYEVPIKYQLWEGNWWFRCLDEWVGYYPASLFNSSGLRSQADVIHFYGEIVDSGDYSGKTATDMGSGYWPDYHWQWSAYMHNLRYQRTTGGSMSDYNGSGWASDTALYDIETHMSSGSSWGSYQWVGGPGA